MSKIAIVTGANQGLGLALGGREPYGELVQHRNVLPFAPTA
jgi:hypothetical protein